jgi:hypothetical protein
MRIYAILFAGCVLGVRPAHASASRTTAVSDTLCVLIDHAYIKSMTTSLRSHIVRKSSGALSEGPHAGYAQIAGPESATCSYVREEPVNGEAASVYRQDVNKDGAGSARSTLIWISKTSGLPLRQEQDADFGDGAKGHESLLFNWAKS